MLLPDHSFQEIVGKSRDYIIIALVLRFRNGALWRLFEWWVREDDRLLERVYVDGARVSLNDQDSTSRSQARVMYQVFCEGVDIRRLLPEGVYQNNDYHYDDLRHWFPFSEEVLEAFEDAEARAVRKKT